MKIQLTKEDAQEVLHKMSVVKDNPDCHEEAGITEEQAASLVASVPATGGFWLVPAWAEQLVKTEMADHCEVLRDIAADARNGREMGQALRIAKQAARLGRLFSS